MRFANSLAARLGERSSSRCGDSSDYRFGTRNVAREHLRSPPVDLEGHLRPSGNRSWLAGNWWTIYRSYMSETSADAADSTSGSPDIDDARLWVPPPWEPPIAGTEVEHLLGALDRQRATFRWKADGLDAAGLNTSIGASTLTIGGLLKHLAVVEDEKFTAWLSGEPLGEPWASLGGPADGEDPQQWIFNSAAADSPAELYAFYDGAVQRSHDRLAAALTVGGLDQPLHFEFGSFGHPSLRRLLFDLLEEYGRHTGHADLIREAIDGRVGEDPPGD
jgi:hypothetical protein